MRIQLTILCGLAVYLVWATTFADVTRELVASAGF
jgi:hypothetical protein